MSAPMTDRKLHQKAARIAGVLSLEQIETRLSAWIEADLALASGQSTSIDGLTITRAEASVVEERIAVYGLAKTLSLAGETTYEAGPQALTPRVTRGRTWL
ncbi:MAG: hypothetical protein EOM25_09480 [Deltaproteobacteria bacterium]|nr:hypothetical protein [Deltaproteobacteria bacterium]